MATSKRTKAQRAVTKALSEEQRNVAREYAFLMRPFLLKWQAAGYTQREIVDLLNDGGAVIPSEYVSDRKVLVAPTPVGRWTLVQYQRFLLRSDEAQERMTWWAKRHGKADTQPWGDGAGLFAWPEEIGLDVNNHMALRDDEPQRDTPDHLYWKLAMKAWGQLIADAVRSEKWSLLHDISKARESDIQARAQVKQTPRPETPPELPKVAVRIPADPRWPKANRTGTYMPFDWRPWTTAEQRQTLAEMAARIDRLKPEGETRRAAERDRNEHARSLLEAHEQAHVARMASDPDYAALERKALKEYDLFQRGRGPVPNWLPEEDPARVRHALDVERFLEATTGEIGPLLAARKAKAAVPPFSLPTFDETEEDEFDETDPAHMVARYEPNRGSR